jgi:DNA helicase IV
VSRDEELAATQAAVDIVHTRVDELRSRAISRAAEANLDESLSTFQETYQRDVMAHHHALRAANLTFGDAEQIVFGQIDASDGEMWRVGRVSVIDDDANVILVDWRADAAEPFYRATSATHMDVARRRRYVARGPRVTNLDDELLDVEAADRLGLSAVTGQGALLAALERTRTGHMRDIVATIQGDQDRIIRSKVAGTLVVSGGPGTGKTVVALHRVAYLLYTQRQRMAGRGVLVVGPSKEFSAYVERVLPALGENRAVMRSLDSFVPHGLPVSGWDSPEVAAISGSAVMAAVCRRLISASLPPLPATTRIVCDDVMITVEGRALQQIRKRLLKRVEPGKAGRRYHDRAEQAEDTLRGVLWQAWSAEAAEQWGKTPNRRDVGFDDALEAAGEVELLRRSWWPSRSPVKVLGVLIDGGVPLAGISDGLLSRDEQSTLRAAWDGRRVPTGDDVALLDELDALLGPTPAEVARAARHAAQDEDDGGVGGIQLVSDATRSADLDAHVPIGGYRYDGYGHVVVDEAQDLSPMQWRMVARRGAYATWTVVGDLAQRARTAEPRTWDEVAVLIGRRQVEQHSLTVNYRTPEEVVEVARAVLVAAGEDPDLAPTSVRTADRRPTLVRADDLTDAALDATRAALAMTEGTVAVITDIPRVAALAAAIGDEFGDLSTRLVVMDARTSKGLEFDEVVIVAPDEIVAASAVGGHALYVAVTRTTTGLTLVATPDADVPGAAHCDLA